MLLSSYQRLKDDQQGMSAIEFAIMLPVLSLILMGVVEFGLTMLKEQSLQRSLTVAAIAVKASPQNQAIADVANSDVTLVNFGDEGNFICSAPYATREAAEAGDCSASQWNTLPPSPDVTSYFVLLKGHVTNPAITGLMDPFISDITRTQIVEIAVSEELVEALCPEGHEVIANDDGGFDCQAPLCRSGFVAVQRNFHRFDDGETFYNYYTLRSSGCAESNLSICREGNVTICCPESAPIVRNMGCSDENSRGSCTALTFRCTPRG